MKLREAIASLHQEHPEDTLLPLHTPWGEQLDSDRVWQEYPRPQFVREDFHILNGKWEYSIVPLSDTTVIPGKPLPHNASSSYGSILVPFSPESLLSGVKKQLMPDEFLWYQRCLSFSQKECAWKTLLKKRCLLHFDAVDQQAVVYINGKEAARHTGGYLPFTIDITEFVSDTPCLLQVRVRDQSDTSYYTRGKQTLKRGGMFYTAQSGIWQSVWYEWVPENYIAGCRITPDYDSGKVTITLYSQKTFQNVTCTLKNDNSKYTVNILSAAAIKKTAPTVQFPITDQHSHSVNTGYSESSEFISTTLTITFQNGDFYPWSPESPYLYDFALCADEDEVTGYFAMRSFTIEKDHNNILRFCLNHKPYFLHGILDQGYWSDGLMTAPCDEAFIFDIELAKKCGFNMLRKHIKIEPLRWYYHCDRLGMIVWQDMVSGGTTYHMPWVCYMPTLFPHISMHTKDHHYRLFSRADREGRNSFEAECLAAIDHLYNVPSLAVWVPFNEGWGQFDAARIAGLVKEKDPTRPVDHASGWFDQKGGDFRSIHNYFRPLKVKLDGKRAFVISEYGGYACHIPGHSSVERIYGYRKYDTPQEMAAAFRRLIEEQLLPLEKQGLSGAVYTQLSDVEEEVNGLVTYDRRVVKL